LLDGLLPLDELPETLDSRELTDEDKQGAQTLGGFVMNQLGNVPAVGQSFIWEGHRFEVIDMDSRRVDKVLVAAVPPSTQATSK
jgi:putative hemolysin